MGTLFVDKLDPQSGTSLELGSSGDTITIPSGATIVNSGTQTGFGEANTPAFFATMSGSTGGSDNTHVKMAFNTEVLDTNNNYDPSSNYRFTPTVAGKYVFNVTLSIEKTGAASGMSYAHTQLYKNGSVVFKTYTDMSANYGYAIHGSVTAVLDMNGSSDYVEAYGYANTSDSTNWNALGGSYGMFSGYKLTT
jgi:hypothetical protein